MSPGQPQNFTGLISALKKVRAATTLSSRAVPGEHFSTPVSIFEPWGPYFFCTVICRVKGYERWEDKLLLYRAHVCLHIFSSGGIIKFVGPKRALRGLQELTLKNLFQ